MLTLYRSNRAELLAQLLATQLQLEPPGLFEPVQVIVNTWPTSRWLGEQIALGNGAGIAANLRFPFPSSRLRQLVQELLHQLGEPETPSPAAGPDPWRAQNLVWPVLELLPALLEQPDAAPLRHWLQQRRQPPQQLDLPLWQLARAIADALDDYPGHTIVWLDGDAELVNDPVLFRHPPADFACHFRTIAGGRKPAPNTIVLRNNDAVRQLLALWIAQCDEARRDPDNIRGLPTHRRDGLVDDAALLQRVLTPPPPFVSIGELPLEYSSIFDNVLVERPVVLQHQASRRLRHGAGSDHR